MIRPPAYHVREIFKEQAKPLAKLRVHQEAIWESEEPGLLDALNQLKVCSGGAFQFCINLHSPQFIETNIPWELSEKSFLDQADPRKGIRICICPKFFNNKSALFLLGGTFRIHTCYDVPEMVAYLSNRIHHCNHYSFLSRPGPLSSPINDRVHGRIEQPL